MKIDAGVNASNVNRRAAGFCGSAGDPRGIGPADLRGAEHFCFDRRLGGVR
ncbi:MAG TPA: hypothetical protein VH985_04035 [Candidatus Binatia bacterium]